MCLIRARAKSGKKAACPSFSGRLWCWTLLYPKNLYRSTAALVKPAWLWEFSQVRTRKGTESVLQLCQVQASLHTTHLCCNQTYSPAYLASIFLFFADVDDWSHFWGFVCWLQQHSIKVWKLISDHTLCVSSVRSGRTAFPFSQSPWMHIDKRKSPSSPGMILDKKIITIIIIITWDDPWYVNGRILLLPSHHVEAEPLLSLWKLDHPVDIWWW